MVMYPLLAMRKPVLIVVALGVTAAAVATVHVVTSESPPDTVLQVGAGGQQVQSASGQQSSQAAERRGWGPAEPGERRYGEIGARMTRPPQDYKPAITAEQAITKARATGLHPQASGSDEVTTELVIYTNDVYGDIQPDGSVKPKHQAIAAWAVRSQSADVVLHQPVRRPGVAPPVTTAEQCPFVYVIDADTGDNLAAFQTCDEEQF